MREYLVTLNHLQIHSNMMMTFHPLSEGRLRQRWSLLGEQGPRLQRLPWLARGHPLQRRLAVRHHHRDTGAPLPVYLWAGERSAGVGEALQRHHQRSDVPSGVHQWEFNTFNYTVPQGSAPIENEWEKVKSWDLFINLGFIWYLCSLSTFLLIFLSLNFVIKTLWFSFEVLYNRVIIYC